MKIKYSIGLPAFKGKYLNDAISSVLSQTFPDFELIIINDCSPDPVNEIVSNFNDPRIRYFENASNLGNESVIKNWNKCLEKSIGEYFILMGDDDVMEANYLEGFNRLITKKPGLNVYHCRVSLIDENSKNYGLSPLCPEFESVYDNIWHRINGYRLQFISDFVYRTSHLIKENGFYELPLAWYSDNITSFIAATEKGIAYTPAPLLNFRKSPESISSSGDTEKKLQAFLGFTTWLDSFLKNEPDNNNDKVLRDLIINFYPEYIKKSLTEALTESYKKDGILKLSRWIRTKNQYNITKKEILMSVFKYLKYKAGRLKKHQ